MAQRIESILIERLLHGKRWLDYLPAERGRRYKTWRGRLIRHRVPVAFAVALVLGAIARWVVPLFVPDFWSRISVGDLGHVLNFGGAVVVVVQVIAWIDRRMVFDPDRFALEHFRTLAFPWLDAYGSLAIDDKRELDHLVITCRHVRDVPDELTYGIMTAKVADVLARTTDATSLRGFDRAQFVVMMRAQKLEPASHQALMERLFAAHVSPEALAASAEGAAMMGMAADPAVLEMLRFWFDHGAFQLRIDLTRALQHVGSQLSRGYLDLRGDVGQNCLSYMGRHSLGSDFPITQIIGDAGASLCTHARRGLVYVTGDVGDDCGKAMTGGTIVVGGRPGNRFGQAMDDTTHPAVLVAYRAIDGYLPLDSIRNGLIVLLNKDVAEAPRALRFRDGAMTELAISGDPQGVYRMIADYVLEWRSTHDSATPPEWA